MWVALLSRGISTAGELTDIVNIPRSRSYDVRESLKKKGFVTIKPRKSIKYGAVQPHQVVESIKKNIIITTKEEIKKLNDFWGNKLIRELVILHSQRQNTTQSSELSGSLQGRSNLYNHIEFMIKNTEKSILISTTENEFIALILRFGHPFE